MTAKRHLNVCFLVFALLLLISLTACAEKESVTLTPDRDAGESIAGALAINTGGLTDQISDGCEFLVEDSKLTEQALRAKFPDRYYYLSTTFDSLNMEWTYNLTKTRGSLTELPYATIHRIYKIKFLNSEAQPQKYYITDGDTARIVNFKIASGEGTFLTRRISHVLDSLYAEWNITNAHLPYVTFNGSYTRASTDTVSGFSRIRTSDNLLQLNLIDVEAPRGFHPNLYSAVSGHITGTFDAEVTFTTGTAYNETTIHREIDIILGGGRADITIGGKDYRADLYRGELID